MPTATDYCISGYRPHIEAALSYAGDTHRYEDVAEMVAAGRATLWPGPASVIVTEIVDHPRKRLLNFFVAGGNLPELLAMTPGILDWGRERGCNRAALLGRPGWSRALASLGFASPATYLERPL